MNEGKAMEHTERAADTAPAETAAVATAAPSDDELRARIVEAISQVYDPEIPVNIYELGLIYRLEVGRDGMVEIDMTLTSPACPVAGSLPGDVETRVRDVEGVNDVHIELVWEPPWSPEKMTEAAKLELGMM
jgi:FeS assembly SUF system protein